MPPQLLILALGGGVLIVSGTMWLLYRLGGFTPTSQERRGWMVALPIVILLMVVMAVIGPLPLPLVLAMNVVLVGYWIWAWRSGRLGIDRAPVDMRDEVAKRRGWMRAHRGVLVALLIGGWLALIIWLMVVVIVFAG